MDVALLWSIWGGISLGLAWIAKDIIKPWSETWRLKVVAEAEHLRKVDEALVMMVSETHKQTDSLIGIDGKMAQNNTSLLAIGTAQATMCKAGPPCIAPGDFQRLIDGIDKLEKQGVMVAEELVKSDSVRAAEARI